MQDVIEDLERHKKGKEGVLSLIRYSDFFEIHRSRRVGPFFDKN